MDRNSADRGVIFFLIFAFLHLWESEDVMEGAGYCLCFLFFFWLAKVLFVFVLFCFVRWSEKVLWIVCRRGRRRRCCCSSFVRACRVRRHWIQSSLCCQTLLGLTAESPFDLEDLFLDISQSRLYDWYFEQNQTDRQEWHLRSVWASLSLILACRE